jgi:hypothetical protein
MPACRLHYINT